MVLQLIENILQVLKIMKFHDWINWFKVLIFFFYIIDNQLFEMFFLNFYVYFWKSPYKSIWISTFLYFLIARCSQSIPGWDFKCKAFH